MSTNIANIFAAYPTDCRMASFHSANIKIEQKERMEKPKIDSLMEVHRATVEPYFSVHFRCECKIENQKIK